MTENQTPAGAPQGYDPDQLVADLMSGQGDAPRQPQAQPPQQPQQGDPLVEELRGDVTPSEPDATADGSTGQAPVQDGETAQDRVMARLKADYKTASERLGDERQARKTAEDERDEFRQRLEALEQGARQPQPRPDQQQANIPLELLSKEQVAHLGAQLDAEFEATAGDFVTKQEAMALAGNAALQAIRLMQNELGSVNQTVQEAQFNQRLAALGIQRSDFDATWEDPAYKSWGENLSDDQRLAALETQATMSGVGPSTPAGQPPQAGAPTTSRVDPRRTIETNQGAGSAQNPQHLSRRTLGQALAHGRETGDFSAARDAATPLFDQLISGGRRGR